MLPETCTSHLYATLKYCLIQLIIDLIDVLELIQFVYRSEIFSKFTFILIVSLIFMNQVTKKIRNYGYELKENFTTPLIS